MADVFLIKRDNTPGRIPSTSQLALGELGINTYDGRLFFKKNDGTESLVELGNPSPDDSISTASLQDGAVTNDKIADKAVSNRNLDSDAVTSDKILDRTIRGSDIGIGAILSENILDGTISGADCDNTVAKQTGLTGSLDLPTGTDAQRDTTYGAGSLRYNTDQTAAEFYTGTTWIPMKGHNGVTVDSNGIQWSGSYTGNTSITGDLSATGTFSSGGNATIGAALSTVGSATIGTTLSTGGNATIGAALSTVGSATIGTTLSTGGNVSVTGNITATGNVTAYSDERLKSDWQPLSKNILDEALLVKHGTFEMDDERGVGVSAQSLETILPEAVFDNHDGYKSVAYGNAALALVLELNRKVAELEAEIQKLKGE